MATTLMPFSRQALKTKRPIRPKLEQEERVNHIYLGKMVGNILRKSHWPNDLKETWSVILVQFPLSI